MQSTPAAKLGSGAASGPIAAAATPHTTDRRVNPRPVSPVTATRKFIAMPRQEIGDFC